MNQSNHRRAAAQILARATLLGGVALMPGTALAQVGETTAPPAATETTGGDIVVSGRRRAAGSDAAALDTQREAPALVSVVGADAIARLPDQNLAAAVGRLPGVAVERDQGQARFISLRGAPNRWTTLSFNGVNVVSPEGRATRLDTLPALIATQVVVRKSVTPDMPGETIAGNIDIVTRSGFDIPGRSVEARGGLGHADLGGGTDGEAALLYTDRFDTAFGEFAVATSASLYRRGVVTDNFQTDWEAVAEDVRPGFADRVWGRETENKLYRTLRGNDAVSERLDWRPAAGHRLFAETVWSRYLDNELRSDYIVDLDDRQSELARDGAACPAARPAARTGYADICTGNTPFRGIVYGVDILADYQIEDVRQSILTNTVGGDHELGGWTIGWRGNLTRAVNARSNPGRLAYASPGFGTNGAGAVDRPTIAYDFSDPNAARFPLYRTIRNPDGTFSQGERVFSIEDFPQSLTSLQSLRVRAVTNAATARMDVTRALDLFGAPVKIAAGLRYDRRRKTAREHQLQLTDPALFDAAGISRDYDAIAVPGGFQGRMPLDYSFRYFGRKAIVGLVDQAEAVADYELLVGNYYRVEERIAAGYLMATATLPWGSIVGGGRIERIINRSEAFAIDSTTRTATPLAVSSARTLVYPSLHVNWDVTRTLKARASFSTGAARADYDQLRPNFTFNDGARTVGGGNPDALPERARGIDLYLEHYPGTGGFLSLGAYYKAVDDVLFASTRTFAQDTLNFGGIDRSQYVYSTTTNGGSGHLYGVEASAQYQLDPFVAALGLPAWTGGFGIQANVTVNRSRAETPDGRIVTLPSTSELIYNLVGYYEKYGFSARLAYQRRSSFLDQIREFRDVGGVVRGIDGGDHFSAADEKLDASIRYAVTPAIELYADATNLLNGLQRRFAGDQRYTLEGERYGRRYMAGIRTRF